MFALPEVTTIASPGCWAVLGAAMAAARSAAKANAIRFIRVPPRTHHIRKTIHRLTAVKPGLSGMKLLSLLPFHPQRVPAKRFELELITVFHLTLLIPVPGIVLDTGNRSLIGKVLD